MLDWLVCYIIDGSTQDDKKDKEVVVAAFRYPDAAQDFIDKCLPEENKDRFYIRAK